MKIVLFALNASYAHASPSVRALSCALADAGFSAKIAEGNLSERTHLLLARLVSENADLYGFSVYIWNVEEMCEIAQNLKQLCPHARVVFGGPEVSFDSERFLELPFVDTVITGEGEEAIVTLVKDLSAGKEPPTLIVGTPYADFTKRGIVYGKEETPERLVYYESSRGCPFSCAFCLSSASDGVRAKSAEDTVADLAEFESFLAPLTVKLVDRTFNFSRERAKAIWRALAGDSFTKCYHFEIAAHLLDEESFQILAEMPKGKVRLEIGLQSTNEKTLAAISRAGDSATVLAAARRLTEAGNLHIHLDLIAGLPFETYASFARGFDEAYFACDVLQLGFLKLLHGTRLRRDADALGIRYSAKAPYTVLKTPDMSFEELEKLHVVSDLLERLRDSGRFPHTLGFLLPAVFSPFAFYDGFAAYLSRVSDKPLQKISQRDLFTHLSAFAGKGQSEDVKKELSAALRADFSLYEVRRAPHGI